MYVEPIRNRFANSGAPNVSVTLSPLAVALSGSGVGPGAADCMAGLFLSRLKVNATSAPVSGRPSLHRTPDRTVNVRVFPPPDQL